MRPAFEVLVIGMLVALFVVVAYKVLAGEINTEGLLSDKQTGAHSPGRLQLLLVTIGGAAYYLYQTIDAAGSGAFPSVPSVLLWGVAAGNAGYLGGKVYSVVSRKTNSLNGDVREV